jgi:hypothetical protein
LKLRCILNLNLISINNINLIYIKKIKKTDKMN